MSVERVERKDGVVVWRVRWRQGGRNRSKVLGRKRDAEAFDAELVRRKRTGELARLDTGKELLAEFGEEWWRLYAEPNLARSTLNVYAVQWDAHVLPRLGTMPLRELTPDAINRFRLELEADGVGPASIRKALILLQGVLQRACEWGRISSNPVLPVRKPPVGLREPSYRSRLRPSRRSVTTCCALASSVTRRWSPCSPTPDCGQGRHSPSRGRTCATARCSSRVQGRWARSRARRQAGAGRCRSLARSRRTSRSGACTGGDPSPASSCSPAMTADRGRSRRTRTGAGGSTDRRRPTPASSARARMT